MHKMNEERVLLALVLIQNLQVFVWVCVCVCVCVFVCVCKVCSEIANVCLYIEMCVCVYFSNFLRDKIYCFIIPSNLSSTSPHSQFIKIKIVLLLLSPTSLSFSFSLLWKRLSVLNSIAKYLFLRNTEFSFS